MFSFVSELCKKYYIVAVITLDQPLWQKATLIIESEPTDSNLRSSFLRIAAGLHVQMNFLSSIGHLMGGSGLQELLAVIYAPNAVTHILIIIDAAALNTVLTSKALEIPVQSSETETELIQNEEYMYPDNAQNKQYYRRIPHIRYN